MSRLLITAAVLAVLVYTMVLGVNWLTPKIEQDIANRVTMNLAEQGMLWTDIAVQGRNVTLSGEAPTAEAKKAALSTAARVLGVAAVQDKILVTGTTSATVAGLKGKKAKRVEELAAEELAKELARTYNLTITKEGDNVILAGNVPDQASKDMLVRLAITHYNGASHVNTESLKIVAGAPAGWRSAVGSVLMHMTNLEQAKIFISGTEVMVSGTVLDRQFSDQMEKAVKQVLPTKYKVAFAVEVVTPTAPVKAVAEDAKLAAVEPAAGEAPAAKTAPATAQGCAAMASVKKEKLRFGFDKAEITATHASTLTHVASTVNGCENGAVVVAGHTDTTGSHLYNRWLSQQRAEATMRALMRDGVNKDAVRAIGYGELHPVASNATRAGRAANRRVEFVPGTELPYPLPRAHAGIKHGKHVKVKAVSTAAATAAAKEVIDTKAPTAAAVQKAPAKVAVSATEIRKPWWARISVGKVVSSTVESAEHVNTVVDHMLQPQPTTAKQPSLGIKSAEKPWLGDSN